MYKYILHKSKFESKRSNINMITLSPQKNDKPTDQMKLKSYRRHKITAAHYMQLKGNSVTTWKNRIYWIFFYRFF